MLSALTWNWHFVIYSFEKINQENMKMRSRVIYEDSLQKSLYWELEVILWCRYFFSVFKQTDENLEVFWIVMRLTLT